MEEIIIRCKDSYLQNDIVTEKTLLECKGITRDILDDMINEGLKNGVFKYEGNYFEVKKKNFRPVIKGKIRLPPVQRNGKKCKFVIDKVKLKNNNQKNETKLYYTIYGERLTKYEFKRRIGISESCLKESTKNSKSFEINGVPVEVSTERKVK